MWSFIAGFFHLTQCFKFHPWCGSYQYFIRFYCQIIFHCIEISDFFNEALAVFFDRAMPALDFKTSRTQSLELQGREVQIPSVGSVGIMGNRVTFAFSVWSLNSGTLSELHHHILSLI